MRLGSLIAALVLAFGRPALAERFPLRIDVAVTPLSVPPGGAVILRGALTDRSDGSLLDAAFDLRNSERGPGLVDFRASGLTLVASDPGTHTYRLVPEGNCAAPGSNGRNVSRWPVLIPGRGRGRRAGDQRVAA